LDFLIRVMCEWAPDYTSPERMAIAELMSQRGGSSALWGDYAMAQISAGLVPVPDFIKKATAAQRKS
jgi:hypothetical protein